MPNIYHQLLINASRETIYKAITSQEGLSRWWIADCTARPEEGFVNEFRMEGHGVNRMRVTELRPNAFVAWTCLNENDEWSGTQLSFALSDRAEFSCLDFKHLGYASENGVYATCNYHWARHLSMLKELCETGHSPLDPQQEKREVEVVHQQKAS